MSKVNRTRNLEEIKKEIQEIQRKLEIIASQKLALESQLKRIESESKLTLTRRTDVLAELSLLTNSSKALMLSVRPVGKALKDLLLQPIARLELPFVTEEFLKSEKIYTVGDLIKLSPSELLRIKVDFGFFGRKRLAEVKRALIFHGLFLKEETCD